MLVEEVPKNRDTKSTTIYFSSSVNLSARAPVYTAEDNPQDDGDDRNGHRHIKSRPKVNYNLTHLMNVQTQANEAQKTLEEFKSSHQVQMERYVNKRIGELARDTLEASKNMTIDTFDPSDKKRARQGNTPTTKKILSSKRTLNLLFEEERDILCINSILSLNYQFVDQIDTSLYKRKNEKEFKRVRPRLKLCCICGSISSYSRCADCGLYSCSVRCNRMHQEVRCN